MIYLKVASEPPYCLYVTSDANQEHYLPAKRAGFRWNAPDATWETTDPDVAARLVDHRNVYAEPDALRAILARAEYLQVYEAHLIVNEYQPDDRNIDERTNIITNTRSNARRRATRWAQSFTLLPIPGKWRSNVAQQMWYKVHKVERPNDKKMVWEGYALRLEVKRLGRDLLATYRPPFPSKEDAGFAPDEIIG